MISPYFFAIMFLFVLGSFVLQIVYIIKARRHEDSITGKIGNIIAIIMLGFETLILIGVVIAIILSFL